MDRRDFLNISLFSLAGLAFAGPESLAARHSRISDRNYSVLMLGDTHYDTLPASVYHSNYNESTEWLNRVQRAEFARNGEMWRERCPSLVRRAAALIEKDTRMVLQMGDLIQGDCGDPEVHTAMLKDATDMLKAEFNGLPFITVAGNHDVRGTGAADAYKAYMPGRMAEELAGTETLSSEGIRGTTFGFRIGDDAYIALDFNTPDDKLADRLLKSSDGARHTFIITHGPVLPMDEADCRWFFHGRDNAADTAARIHFRHEFARRNAICLCGHSHRTRLTEWKGDGGIITQLEMNSVWARASQGKYEIKYSGSENYGLERLKKESMPDGSPLKDESALFDEYRPGITRYEGGTAAGSFLMRAGARHVDVTFHAGDSEKADRIFRLR